jgi:S-adenosylmethionine:tRNA ribosyltransferase-isomerase
MSEEIQGEEMKLSDFDFDLPDNLIAQNAVEPRDYSKLMVLDKNKQTIEHKKFYNIADYLKKGDVLVVNRTRVIPARLFGKKDTGSILECFLLKRLDLDTWEVLLKPAKKLKIGQKLIFLPDRLEAVLKEIKDDGNRVLEFIYKGNFEEILDELGEMPLPPYITEKLQDKNRYQTVYAKEGESVAAPTAGLHFTNELLDKLKDSGVELTEIYLDVGLGTFRPVQTENILEHKMHYEKFHIPEESAKIINRAKKEGRRIIAVGTTTVRTLESSNNGTDVISGDGETDIFIYGDYKFKIIDALITNFHLPKSTLLMLISAFAGKDFVFDAYKTAIQEKYRFYSFGDAMYIY